MWYNLSLRLSVCLSLSLSLSLSLKHTLILSLSISLPLFLSLIFCPPSFSLKITTCLFIWSISAYKVIQSNFSLSDKYVIFKSLFIDRTLDCSKLNFFADDKETKASTIGFIFKQIENIVKKVLNAAYQHFLLFSTMFSRSSQFRVVEDTG